MKTKFKTKEAKIRFASNEANTDLLIKGLLADDSKAYSEFFQQYRNLVCHEVLKWIKNAHDMEEIVNDTFLSFFLAVDRLKNISAVTEYLIRIARNICFDRFRSKEQKMEKVTLSIESMSVPKQIELNITPAPHQHHTNKKLGATIKEAIGLLPTKQSQVFKMVCLEGYTYQDVAEEMDCDVNAVYANFHRAKEFLRRELRETLEDYQR